MALREARTHAAEEGNLPNSSPKSGSGVPGSTRVSMLSASTMSALRAALLSAGEALSEKAGQARAGSPLLKASRAALRAGALSGPLASRGAPAARCSRSPTLFSPRDTAGRIIMGEFRMSQCCGSGMFIPDPDFYPSRIPDLGSRIQKQQQKRGMKKIVVIFFL